MERYTRTPYYKGEDDPEIGEVRGPLKLGETVVIETVGGHDQDYENNHESYQAGSTVHIRAQKPGGLMTLTDVHARMGDGELTATGVEIDSAITLKVDRSPGFPCSSPVVEKTKQVEPAEEWLTSGRGVDWEESVKIAWSEMVALIADRYDTSAEYANLIVGTIADARPGYAAAGMTQRGQRGSKYITCQLAVTKELRRTGQPYKH